MTTSDSARVRVAALAAFSLCALLLVAALPPDALAQARNPFNVGISEGGGQASGITGWILAQQASFERLLAGAVRAIKTEPSAVWTLAGLSFAYGVFHAAGPGHGKAVVASYMIANERALRRGLAISFLAAILQGVVAIAIVGVLALALNATAARMKSAANLVEFASYAGIALLGVWLVWRKGAAFLSAWRARTQQRADAAHGHGDAHHDHAHDDHGHHDHGHHDHSHHDHGHHDHAPAPAVALAGVGADVVRRADSHHHHDHGHTNHDHGDHDHHAHDHHHDHSAHAHPAHGEPGHVHDEHCGHFHAPDPKTLGEGFSWGGALATVFTAGLRPCSGAILVLVFALAQGVFLAGVLATAAMSLGTALTTGALAALAVLAKTLAVRFVGGSGGAGSVLAVRALELLAAGVVLALGLGLTFGALANGVAGFAP